MKIGVARLWHETNSFAPGRVGREQFASREWLKGPSADAAYRGTPTEIGGALAWARETGCELIFSRLAASLPGGPVEQELLDEIIAEIVADDALADVDGLYLSLHGACLGTRDPSAETTLCAALRRRFPGLPIAASLDMHCIPTEELAGALDVATVYRTYPHTDMQSAAVSALELLGRVIASGRRGEVALARTGIVLPSFNMATEEGAPMREIQDNAQSLERFSGEDALAVYPYASFAYADTPATDSGVLTTAIGGDAAAAASGAAQQVVARMRSERGRFRPALEAAESVLAARPWAKARRVAVLEPSDNPFSGGGADTPGLLRAALAAGVPEGTIFAFFHDPACVETARAAGRGGGLEREIGARLDQRFGAPVPIRGRVERLTDGVFVNKGPMERGLRVDLGPTAVLKVGPIRLIVTSRCGAVNDPGFFALHGVELDRAPLLLAKAKNHFRAAFAGLFDEILLAETPGPAMADCAALPFRHIPPDRFA